MRDEMKAAVLSADTTLWTKRHLNSIDDFSIVAARVNIKNFFYVHIFYPLYYF